MNLFKRIKLWIGTMFYRPKTKPLDNDIKNLYDSLSDKELMAFFLTRWKDEVPVFEECSQEEYDSYRKRITSFSQLDFHLHPQYKCVPTYQGRELSIMELVYLGTDHEIVKPDGYKYYKRTGYKTQVYVSASEADYLNKRGINFE